MKIHKKLKTRIRFHPCEQCWGTGKRPDVDSMIEAREALRIPQASMARSLEVTRGYLCDVERGRRPVSARIAHDYLELLGLAIDEDEVRVGAT